MYANYDMDEGDISEYLEILVKYWDGVEDTAMYRLSRKEQEMFLRKMDDYSQHQTGKSLSEWQQEYKQQQMRTQEMPGQFM